MNPGRAGSGHRPAARIAGRSPARFGVAGVLVALAAQGLAGCSVSPAEQQAIRDAWAARDAERAAECRRKNIGYVAGGCATGAP